jgi:hypothetical protein
MKFTPVPPPLSSVNPNKRIKFVSYNSHNHEQTMNFAWEMNLLRLFILNQPKNRL